MTTVFYKPVILQWEIGRWSFLGLKGLLENPKKIIEKRLGSTLKIVRFREPSVRISNSVVTGDFEENFLVFKGTLSIRWVGQG